MGKVNARVGESDQAQITLVDDEAHRYVLAFAGEDWRTTILRVEEDRWRTFESGLRRVGGLVVPVEVLSAGSSLGGISSHWSVSPSFGSSFDHPQLNPSEWWIVGRRGSLVDFFHSQGGHGITDTWDIDRNGDWGHGTSWFGDGEGAISSWASLVKDEDGYGVRHRQRLQPHFGSGATDEGGGDGESDETIIDEVHANPDSDTDNDTKGGDRPYVVTIITYNEDGTKTVMDRVGVEHADHSADDHYTYDVYDKDGNLISHQEGDEHWNVGANGKVWYKDWPGQPIATPNPEEGTDERVPQPMAHTPLLEEALDRLAALAEKEGKPAPDEEASPVAAIKDVLAGIVVKAAGGEGLGLGDAGEEDSWLSRLHPSVGKDALGVSGVAEEEWGGLNLPMADIAFEAQLNSLRLATGTSDETIARLAHGFRATTVAAPRIYRIAD